MSDDLGLPPSKKSETALRVLVLGAIYATAIGFVVALSPSMGLVTPHPTGEVGRVASAPEPAHSAPAQSLAR